MWARPELLKGRDHFLARSVDACLGFIVQCTGVIGPVLQRKKTSVWANVLQFRPDRHPFITILRHAIRLGQIMAQFSRVGMTVSPCPGNCQDLNHIGNLFGTSSNLACQNMTVVQKHSFCGSHPAAWFHSDKKVQEMCKTLVEYGITSLRPFRKMITVPIQVIK